MPSPAHIRLFSLKKTDKSIAGWLALATLMLASTFWLAYGDWLGSGGLVIGFAMDSVPYKCAPEESNKLALFVRQRRDWWPSPHEPIWTSLSRLTSSGSQPGVPLASVATLRPGPCTIDISYAGTPIWKGHVTVFKDRITTNLVPLETLLKTLVITNLPAISLFDGTSVDTNCVIPNVLVGNGRHFILECQGFMPINVDLSPTNFAPTIIIDASSLIERRGFAQLTVNPVSIVPTEVNRSMIKGKLAQARWSVVAGPGSAWQGKIYSFGSCYTLRTGQYLISASNSDFLTTNVTILIEDHKTNTSIVSLGAIPAKLLVGSTPPSDLTSVKDDTNSVFFETNMVSLLPGPHSVTLCFSPEYDPVTCISYFSPNVLYSNHFTLHKANSSAFKHLLDSINDIVRTNTPYLDAFGGVEWAGIKSSLASAETDFRDRPASGLSLLVKSKPQIEALIAMVRSRQQFNDLIQASIRKGGVENYVLAFESLKKYAQYLNLHGVEGPEDGDVVQLRKDIQNNLRTNINDEFGGYVRAEEFGAASNWLAKLPALVVTNMFPITIESLNMQILHASRERMAAQLRADEELEALKRNRDADQLRAAINNAVLNNDYHSANAALSEYSKAVKVDSALMAEVAAKRRAFYAGQLLALARARDPDDRAIVAELRDYISAGGAEDKTLLAELVISELFDQKNFKLTEKTIDSIGKDATLNVWSKAQTDEFKQKVHDLRGGALLFFDDANAIQNLKVNNQ